MGAPVFLGREGSFLALDPEQSRGADAGVVVLPVPFERTSSYGGGSAAGPAALLEASAQVELYDAALGREPYRDAGGIATLAPLEVAGLDGPAVADRLEAACAPWLERGRLVAALGGEHTSIVGAVRACCRRRPRVTVLQLDAHSDLRDSYLGDPWSHACAAARILDFHADLVQVGIRSQDRSERERAEALGLPVFPAHEIEAADRSGRDWVGEIVERLAPEVYLTLDIDVLEPAIMPATGTPEPGGLTWWQVDRLLARLGRERRLLGLDLSELAPIPGVHHPQFTAARLVHRIIGHGLRP